MEKVRVLPQVQASALATTCAPAIGRVVDVPEPGIAMVRLDANEPRKTRLVAALAKERPDRLVGQEVVLLFEGNDPNKPIALALLRTPSEFAEALQIENREQQLDARVDGERVVIEAKKRLELRVGKASIVIDEQGKITIRGAHLLNRATGPIRIKGGHVDIN